MVWLGRQDFADEDFDSEDEEPLGSSESSGDSGRNQKSSAAKLLGVLGPGADEEAASRAAGPPPPEIDLDAPLEDVVWRRL